MRVVITVPHAFCESHAAILEHACDTVATYAARGLAHHLREAGWDVHEVEGTINRRRLDLNRRASLGDAFHAQIDQLLRPGDMLLDVHSYPGAAPDPLMQLWGENVLVLCAFDQASDVVRGSAPQTEVWQGNAAPTHRLAAALNRRDLPTLVQYPTGEPTRAPRPHESPVLEEALRHYFVVQHHGSRANPALMLEFNEDVGLTKLSEAAAVIGQELVRLFGSRTIGSRLSRPLVRTAGRRVW